MSKDVSSDGAIGGMSVNMDRGLEMVAGGLGRRDSHGTTDVVSVVKVIWKCTYRVAVLPAIWRGI